MIEARGLSKHYRVFERPPGLAAALHSLVHREYRTVRAVDGVSFTIADGERVGFLGPNGAGKTTTLKTLCGLLHPTEGEVTVDGFVPWRREAAFLKRIMLVAGQKQQLSWDLPAAESFELNRAVYEVPRAQYRETLDELVALLDLGALLGKPVRQLSLGERMKCELAASLLHRPRVLFLDEPTIGLDVVAQSAVRGFIRRYNERHGATVMLTSHAMDDVTALCPRVVVIDRGRITFDGALDELVRRTRPGKRVRLRTREPVAASALEAAGLAVTRSDGLALTVDVAAGDLSARLAWMLAQLPVEDLTVEDPPLEEVLAELFARGESPP